MILTVSELREYIDTPETDDMLKARLMGMELMIRAHTNNNFQVRGIRCTADIIGGVLVMGSPAPFAVGDTVQVTETDTNATGLVTVTEVDGGIVTVDETLMDDALVLVTKVEYPMDVKMGIVNMMKWELERRDKVGISSESISRHSQTFFDMTGDNSIMGYPTALMGFLRPYKRARFGQGVRI